MHCLETIIVLNQTKEERRKTAFIAYARIVAAGGWRPDLAMSLDLFAGDKKEST